MFTTFHTIHIFIFCRFFLFSLFYSFLFLRIFSLSFFSVSFLLFVLLPSLIHSSSSILCSLFFTLSFILFPLCFSYTHIIFLISFLIPSFFPFLSYTFFTTFFLNCTCPILLCLLFLFSCTGSTSSTVLHAIKKLLQFSLTFTFFFILTFTDFSHSYFPLSFLCLTLFSIFHHIPIIFPFYLPRSLFLLLILSSLFFYFSPHSLSVYLSLFPLSFIFIILSSFQPCYIY